MAIGSVYGRARRNVVGRELSRLFGSSDYHSHLRLKPLFLFLKRRINPAADILELGCGAGIVLIETCFNAFVRRAVGVDIDEDSITQAEMLRAEILPQANLRFMTLNALSFNLDETFDLILLVDVLEHIEDTRAMIEVVHRHIRPNGLVLVSVPTPLFPKVFGRRFHDSIGHVRDGYVEAEIKELFHGFDLIHCEYSTGPLVLPFCALYYRVVERFRSRSWRQIAGFSLLVTAWLDIWHPKSMSCSMFLAFRAPK